jgi:hypothetical protein
VLTTKDNVVVVVETESGSLISNDQAHILVQSLSNRTPNKT